MEEYETKEERLKRLNVERVRRYKQKHGAKQFSVEFVGDEIETILEPLFKRLNQDNVTCKEFLKKSFEEYCKRGGFSGD